jgi:hypothetical protein
MAAIYPPAARANGVLPAPDFFDGTVVARETAIGQEVKALLSLQTSRAPI